MLYVSDEFNGSYAVVDSVSGVMTEVREVSKNVLGYVGDGVVAPVSKYLLNLLSYIKSIELESAYNHYDNDINVCGWYPVLQSPHNIFVKWDEVPPVYSILDLLVIASFNKSFFKIAESGVVNLCFGRKLEMKYVVTFCGNYISYLTKVIVLWRRSEEVNRKLEILWGLEK